AGGGRSHAAAARRAAGPRAGPRAAARLPRQPAANGGRDAALLPSRGVVGLDAGARGARALLRRPGGRHLWRRACLRDGPAQDGATARRTGARARGGRRLAARSRPPPPGAGDARRLPALARRRLRRGARAGGGDREWLGPASLLAGLRGFADRTRDGVARSRCAPRCGEGAAPSEGCPDPAVRREAVKSIRDEAPRAAAVLVLREIARRDRDPDVHRKAVRALAKVASVSSAAGGSRPAPPASRGA